MIYIQTLQIHKLIIIQHISLNSISIMDPSNIFQFQDMSISMLQAGDSPKLSKTQSSVAKSKRKHNVFDSLSYDHREYEPPTQSTSKQTSQSPSINTFTQQNHQKQKMKHLYQLQQQLQKQYLMLIKQQSQKSKFIKEIEDQMKNYYSLLIETKQQNIHNNYLTNFNYDKAKNLNKQSQQQTKKVNKIVADDGFDNCYNFIKQVIINTSKHNNVAITLLLNCTISYNKQQKDSIFIQDYFCLIDLIINVLYQRASQTDPFLKQITKLVSDLLSKLPILKDQEKQTLTKNNKQAEQNTNQKLIKTNYQKIMCVFSVYMKKQQINDYFQILSNKVLKNIQKVSFTRAKNRSRTGISLHQSKSIIDTQSSIDMQKQFGDPGSSFGYKFQQNWLEYLKPFQSFKDQKRALAMNYLGQIYNQADLCPLNLKIVLKYFYQNQSKYYEQKYHNKSKYELKLLTSLRLWQLIENYYLKGFDNCEETKNILLKQMSLNEKQILVEIKQMINKFFRGINKKMYLEDDELIKVYKKSKKFIIKVVQKLIAFGQKNYDQFKAELVGILDKKQRASQNKSLNMNEQNKSNPVQIKLPSQLIRIFGGCISFKQIYVLLTSMRRIHSKIGNQRIVNRVLRIFDMSPQLQFLTKHKLLKSSACKQHDQKEMDHLYIILIQHQLDQLISNDYRNLYTKEYEDDKIKTMIRQIMCQLKLKQLSSKVNKRELVNKKKVNIRQFQLEDLKMFKKNNKVSPIKTKEKQNQQTNVLMNILHKISTQCSKSVEGAEVQFSLHKGVSLQLLKKIKYLLYLFQNKSSQLNQHKILKQMLQQVKDRNTKMIQIYQHTKFGLLAAISNIKHYKNLLISKKQAQQKIQLRIKNIKILQSLKLNICITSPYTRSHPQTGCRQNSPFKESYQNSFISSQASYKSASLKSSQKITSSSFTKQKPSHEESPSKKVENKQQIPTVFIEPYNKYKYRISNADEIVLCQTDQCIHKDNIFLGLNYHANSLSQFINMFSNLRQVSQNMFFAKFIISQDTSHKVYSEISEQFRYYSPINHKMWKIFTNKKYKTLNYSIDKINAVLTDFIEYLTSEKLRELKNIQKKSQIMQLKKIVKQIVFRGLHQKLVKSKQNKIKITHLHGKQVINQKQQNKHKFKCMNNHGLDKSTQKLNILKDFDNDNQQIEQQILKSEQKTNKMGKSQNIQLHQQKYEKNYKNQSTSPKKDLQKIHFKNFNQNSLKQDQERDNTIFKSKNDQILLFQIQKLKNNQSYSFSQQLGQSQKQSDINYRKKQIQTLYKKLNNEAAFNIKQLQQVCARCIKNINKKQTPEDKIQLLKNIIDFYKLLVKENTNLVHQTNHYQNTNCNKQQKNQALKNHHNYNLQRLIFQSIMIAEPQNFITNLAFIEMFLHKDKLLSNEGKVLNQFKTVAQHIFQMKQD